MLIKAHKASKTMCRVWSLKSPMKTNSSLKEIITLSKEVFRDFESVMAVPIRNLGNVTWKTAKGNDAVKPSADS